MTLSAKWTAVTFSALTALGAGSFAFAGCTITEGDPDRSEGGIGNNPPVDGGGGTDTSTPAKLCPGNTKQTLKYSPAACQAALEEECCAELTACFTTPTAAAASDCNVFVACIDNCEKPTTDGGAAPTVAERNKCVQDFCVPNATAEIATAYDKIIDCKEAKPKSLAACK